MLGLGVSLAKGGVPKAYVLRKEYAPDFSAGIDDWTAVSDSPALTPVAPSTLDGVSDVLLYTVASDVNFIAAKSSEINSSTDDNTRVLVTADVYVESNTAVGSLDHIVGNFTGNQTAVSIPNNEWTSITLLMPDIGNISGAYIGFRTIGKGLSVGDKIGIKNYVMKVYEP